MKVLAFLVRNVWFGKSTFCGNTNDFYLEPPTCHVKFTGLSNINSLFYFTKKIKLWYLRWKMTFTLLKSQVFGFYFIKPNFLTRHLFCSSFFLRPTLKKKEFIALQILIRTSFCRMFCFGIFPTFLCLSFSFSHFVMPIVW